MSHIPKQVRDKLIESLSDKDYPSYGQVATVDQDLRPEVRTVHFRWIPELETVGFCTCTKSPKWIQLNMRPAISCCYYDAKRQIQFRWRGQAVLTGESLNTQHFPIIDRLWEQSRDEVKKAYWELSEKSGSISDRCPIYGAVFIEPEMWDLFFVVEHQYRDGKRFIYNRASKDSWSERRVSLIDSHSLS